MGKKFKVTFYTNVVYPTADDVSQDQFTVFYEMYENATVDDVAGIVETDLKLFTFMKDESSGRYSTWYYRTKDVTSFSITEIKEEQQNG